ncbi:MAG: hypothetical protein H6732_06000 [Alphaproteobacteria bacterium]|nr:hypothetical protein [Alphaproteobacteria bacterium]
MGRMVRGVVVLGSLLWAGGEALAAPNNFAGGRAGGRQAYVTAGFADVEGGVFLPVGPVELKPRFRFGFNPLGRGGLALVPEVGLDVRWQLIDGGDFSGSLVLGVDVPISIAPATGGVAVGFGLGNPGFLMTYRIENVVDLDFGVLVEPTLVVSGGAVGVQIDLPLIFGVEFEVTKGIVLGVRAEGGPSLTTGTAFGGTALGVGPYVRALVGVSFGF